MSALHLSHNVCSELCVLLRDNAVRAALFLSHVSIDNLFRVLSRENTSITQGIGYRSAAPDDIIENGLLCADDDYFCN